MNTSNHGNSEGWIIYCDDLSESKVPEMYEALKKRLT
jgi:predicted AAA+ superfamily ATPase